MKTLLTRFYHGLILERPKLAVLLVLAFVAFMAVHMPQFRLDASSDTLSLESDKALDYYRDIRQRYGSDDFLIMTYDPKQGLFTQETLDDIEALKGSLQDIDHLSSVLTLMDVPLVESPSVTLSELQEDVPTLRDEDVTLSMGKKELTTSPLYKNLIVNEAGELTAILIELKGDTGLKELREERASLRSKKKNEGLNEDEAQQLEKLNANYQSKLDKEHAKQERAIAQIREVIEAYKPKADIFLGGVPMIVVDSINFIQKDLRVFGIGVFVFLVILLWIIFRRKRWVFLPMVTCSFVGISAIGGLGFLNWPATIVSANFVALLLIFTLSFCVHQIVRFREFCELEPKADIKKAVADMVSKIGVPCFYMGLTTIVAFGSLIVSDIRPIIDFGQMMMLGIAMSFVITFVFFPACLIFFGLEHEQHQLDFTDKVAGFFSHLVLERGKLVLFISIVMVAICAWGTSKLYVQNSFIDYYKDDTAIHQGMVTIDQKLGGTTPMDVIVSAPQSYIDFQEEERALMADYGYGETTTGPDITQGYWADPSRFDKVAQIHRYLNSLQETGKVLSFHTTIQMLRSVMGEDELDRFTLGVVYKKAPEQVKDTLLSPYISEDGNELRFGIRIYETAKGLDRAELLGEIRNHLTGELGLTEEQVRLTGMVVLYNNVLQSLFDSQINTLLIVFGVIFLVFLALFRRIGMALLALVPNVVIVLLVFGIMGLGNIPLDIMTITIAAICFGIANDNTIHFIHRYMAEFEKDHDYKEAVKRSHKTIGRAMYYTSVTIGLGFSILALSNFVPTIYFGLLTAISMGVALLADMALLPLLIIMLKPLGKNKA